MKLRISAGFILALCSAISVNAQVAAFGSQSSKITTVERKNAVQSKSNSVAKDLTGTPDVMLRVHQAAGDLTWGDTPNPQEWHAAIHELVNRKGNVTRRYLHVTGTSNGEGLQVRAVNLPGTKTQYLIAEIDIDGDNMADGERFEFPEFNISEIDDIRIFGLAGDDRIRNQTSLPDFLFGGLGDDELRGGDGPSMLFGQDGRDILLGGGGDDLLFGEDGDDDLAGGFGSDELFGGPGTDRLCGCDSPWDAPLTFDDGSPDYLSGGSWADEFYVSSNEDELTDFNAGEGDEEIN